MFVEFAQYLSFGMHQPVLLCFYAGGLIAWLRPGFEFPKGVDQGLTTFLLLAMGWQGGSALVALPAGALNQALGFIVVGFFTNLGIGLLAYGILRRDAGLRLTDAATAAGDYGSASAGAFATAVVLLTTANIAFAPYLPVLFAAMELPGCLVALYLAASLRADGLNGGVIAARRSQPALDPEKHVAVTTGNRRHAVLEEELAEVGASASNPSRTGWPAPRVPAQQPFFRDSAFAGEGGTAIDQFQGGNCKTNSLVGSGGAALDFIAGHGTGGWRRTRFLSAMLLGPGIFLLVTGIALGAITQLRDEANAVRGNALFSNLFRGALGLFLVQMGATTVSMLRDRRATNWRLVSFGLWAPNLFAAVGVSVAHLYSLFLGRPFELGTYALFAVLCGSASCIALPSAQRMAIREASPRRPLASALGLTFFYNITLGLPVYLFMANLLLTWLPVHSIQTATLQP